ncbi:MAG: hypothetical protein L0Y66_23700 [Myxococcaceae bacterium]|nr:hypothetical protein [Myxococcaceae bacterium]MCI0672648.1 hypothetical protein [Myxococcaceae bacterium]
MDELESTWAAQDAHLARASVAFVHDELVAGLRRRASWELAKLLYALLSGVVLAAFVVWIAVTRRSPEVQGVWMSAALLVPVYALIALRVRASLQGRAEARRLGHTVVDAARVSLSAVEREERFTRRVLWAQALTAALLPVLVWREATLGLVRPGEALAQAGLLASLLGVAALLLRYRLQRVLRPRRERLRALLGGARPLPGDGVSIPD